MRTITLLSAALVALAAPAMTPVLAQPPASSMVGQKTICLNVKDIDDSISKDGETIAFKMKNGTTVVNHLMNKCDSLKFGGFTWVTAPGGEICGGSQTLRAQVTGEICRLGKFDPPVKTATR
jgi:hypothetical protein